MRAPKQNGGKPYSNLAWSPVCATQSNIAGACAFTLMGKNVLCFVLGCPTDISILWKKRYGLPGTVLQ